MTNTTKIIADIMNIAKVIFHGHVRVLKVSRCFHLLKIIQDDCVELSANNPARNALRKPIRAKVSSAGQHKSILSNGMTQQITAPWVIINGLMLASTRRTNQKVNRVVGNL